MKIEPGDSIELFSDQVQGCYWQACYSHGMDWMPHTARPGTYEVLQVEGNGVLLGICCKLGGMDVFRCSMDSLRAVVLPEYHHKPLAFTIQNSGLADRIYTEVNGCCECVAEVVNMDLCRKMLAE